MSKLRNNTDVVIVNKIRKNFIEALLSHGSRESKSFPRNLIISTKTDPKFIKGLISLKDPFVSFRSKKKSINAKPKSRVTNNVKNQETLIKSVNMINRTPTGL